MFEGKVHYDNTIEQLKRETNESKLSKALTTFIRQKELVESVSGI
jgi:hypothetical protein